MTDSNNSACFKWGIMGSGLIVQDFSNAVRSLKTGNHVLYAVYDRNINDAKKFADKFNTQVHTDSLETFLADPKIDAVYIGTVNQTHASLTMRALEAGKNVLCEKPMSLNSVDQEKIFKLAQEKQVFFMEGIWVRFFPSIREIQEDIANDTIGEPKYFIGNFMSFCKNQERIKNKEYGGGVLFDVGIYPIQMALLVFGHEKPSKITASGHLMSTGVDEMVSITLLFSRQRVAQINLSINCDLFTPSFIIGEKGVIQIAEWFPCEYIKANGQKVIHPLPECPPTTYRGAAGLSYEAEQVRQAIQSGLKQHPMVTHEHSRLIFSIIEEAKRQIEASSLPSTHS